MIFHIQKKITTNLFLVSKKQSVEEVLIQRTVIMTIQRLFYRGSLDKNDNADEILSGCLFLERRRPDLQEVKVYVIQ